MAKAAAKKRCFIVGPIGKPDGEERIHSDWLLEGVILPVFSANYPDFVVQRADKISKAGMINTQIIEALLDAELVIADITTLNPNCFYEIGIRHVMQKPIIHMHLAGQAIPFDIAPFRSIEFARVWPKDLERAKVDLKAFVDEALDPDYVVENPVTIARGKIEFEKSATPAQKAIREELDDLRDEIAMLKSARRRDGGRFHVVPNLMTLSHLENRKILLKEPEFEVRLTSWGHTSTAQLHAIAEKYLPKYFEVYDVYRSTEIDVGVRLFDTPENREFARIFQQESVQFEHPVKVMIQPPSEG